VELKQGVLRTEELKKYREEGGLALKVTLTLDAESVYKSLSGRDLKTPAEKTLLGHVCWLRELLQLRLIEVLQWCDTRDMTADGHTKGCIDRQTLLEVMKGHQSYKHEVKKYIPHRSEVTCQ
jgi:chaperone required for assembly of F1-ATPase